VLAWLETATMEDAERVIKGAVNGAVRAAKNVQVTSLPDTRPSAERHAAGVASSSAGTNDGSSSIASASRSA